LVTGVQRNWQQRVQSFSLCGACPTSASAPQIIDEALDYCMQHGITSAGDFKAIVAHYLYVQTDNPPQGTNIQLTLNPLNNQPPDQALIQPATSSINDYDMF